MNKACVFVEILIVAFQAIEKMQRRILQKQNVALPLLASGFMLPATLQFG